MLSFMFTVSVDILNSLSSIYIYVKILFRINHLVNQLEQLLPRNEMSSSFSLQILNMLQEMSVALSIR